MVFADTGGRFGIMCGQDYRALAVCSTKEINSRLPRPVFCNICALRKRYVSMAAREQGGFLVLAERNTRGRALEVAKNFNKFFKNFPNFV